MCMLCLDKMDGVTTAATSCSKQGKNMTRSCVLGRDDKDRRLSDSSADDVDDDVTRQEGAAAVAGPSTTKGEVSSSYTSKRETIEDFLNSCGDYLQRQPTDKSGKKRVSTVIFNEVFMFLVGAFRRKRRL